MSSLLWITTVTKQWVDGTGTSATMQLLADGVAATEDQLGVQPGAVTLTGSETEPWTHTWEKLPKYSNGHEIVYPRGGNELCGRRRYLLPDLLPVW